MAAAEPVFRSVQVERIDALATALGDLLGFTTLIYELMQNADDAHGATKMLFDVRDDALIVENDGLFTDCGHQELAPSECPFLADLTTTCDFHSFRNLEGGAKRTREDTTGAFGIGFTAVYQLTDQPELISGSRHWLINQLAPDAEVIAEQPVYPSLDRTRFVLPWARKPSELRARLRTSVVPDGTEAKFLDALVDSVPLGMLFLRKLSAIDLKRDGDLVDRIERVVEDRQVVVRSATSDVRFYRFSGNFNNEAAELRVRHAEIESTRSEGAQVAIPAREPDGSSRGRLYAGLPTEERSPVAFHICADFFPTTDRKRIALGDDYKSEWNRAALAAAAEIFAEAVPELAPMLGAGPLWDLLASAARGADEARKGDVDIAFAAFWDETVPTIQQSPVVLTNSGEWCTGDQALLLQQIEEYDAAPLLERIGLRLVDRDIRRVLYTLRSYRVDLEGDLGIQELKVGDVLEALLASGVGEVRTDDAIAPVLRERTQRDLLWDELERLLSRLRSAQDRESAERAVADSATAPREGGGLCSWERSFAAVPASVEVFGAFVDFIDLRPLETRPTLARLAAPFTALDAARLLSELGHGEVARLDRLGVLRWLATRLDELEDPEIVSLLEDVPLFPSGGDFYPLSDLLLPGDFEDPLGMTVLLDVQRVPRLRDLAAALGAEELTFERYVREYVPARLHERTLDPPQHSELLQLLARRLDEFEGDGELRGTLAETPLVLCADGQARAPGDVYFATQQVRAALGDDVPVAGEAAGSVRRLYEWLGVEAKPRPRDLIARIGRLAAGRPIPEAIYAVDQVIAVMGAEYRAPEDRRSRDELAARFERDYGQLRGVAWLPARGEVARWYEPAQLYRRSREYLFSSQARFLAIDRRVENDNVFLLELLDVGEEPTAAQVVDHLLHCARSSHRVNLQVYEFLNQKVLDGDAESSEVDELDRLRDQAVILVEDDRYLKPTHVFWADHQLAPFRAKLADEQFSRWHALLSAIGVKNEPDYDDAIELMREISRAVHRGRRLAEDSNELQAVQRCWQTLELALADGQVDEQVLRARLGSTRVVPNAAGELELPHHVFVEDLAGLRDAFSRHLGANVIARPRAAWLALHASGMKGLREAADAEIVLAEGEAPDVLLRQRLDERGTEVARVLDGVLDGEELRTAQSWLERLRFFRVDDLHVRWHLRTARGLLSSEAERAGALYAEDADAIYVRYVAGQVASWASVAREIAGVSCQTTDPGRIASPLKEVLAATTVEDAARELDELGIPRVQPAVSPAPPAWEVGFGSDDNLMVEVEPPPDDGMPDTGAISSEAVEGEDREPDEEEQEGEPGAGPERTGAGSGTLGGESAPSGETPETAAGKAAVSGVSGPRRRPEFAAQEKGGAWLVQISGPSSEERSEESSERQERRREVDAAGIRRALEYERAAKREPREMEHHNPGYDIESYEQGGQNVARFIEVKATSSDWTAARPIPMSSTQFDVALTLGERYWLYVVVRADQPDFEIFPISNPATKATEFRLDPGWKQAVEPPETSSQGSEGLLLISAPALPDTSTVVFDRESREDGDVPYLEWSGLGGIGKPGFGENAPLWFTSPADVRVGDFAIQQREAGMGSTLPSGAIGVFRPLHGQVEDGDIVLADVANDGGDPRLAIRRAYLIRQDDGELEALQLVCDVPGGGADLEFDDPYALGRVLAVLVAHQEL